jgi:hypothetical protein
MEKKWLARPYRYADGVPWNDDRYEVFVEVDEGKSWFSIGGAIRSWDQSTVAFLCYKTMQRKVRSPQDAVDRTEGLFVVAPSVRESLHLLKWRWPNPELTLLELERAKDFMFNI